MRESSTTTSNVVDLEARRPENQPSENVRCRCGGEWWVTDVVVARLTGRVTGWVQPSTCSSCGERYPGT